MSVAASVPHSSTFCSGNRREVTTAEQPPMSVRSDGKGIEIRPRSNTAAGVLKHMGRKRSTSRSRGSRKASLVYPSCLYESFVSGAESRRESFVSANSLGEKVVWSDQSELDEGSLQYIDETEEVDDTDEGIGSLGCIFSLWNTMVGSTIIVLPYGFHEAGPIVGSLIAALAAGCSLFTAQMIASTGTGCPDYGVICGERLGPWAKHLATTASLVVFSGVLIVYQIMMTDSLVNLVKLFWDDMNEIIGAAIVAIALFPVCIQKDMTLVIRINAWGVASILFILLFMTVQSIRAWADGTAGDISKVISDDLSQFKVTGVGTLCGMLGAGFFSHNTMLPILANKKDRSTNARDCAIAYACVFVSYLVAGCLPALMFDSEMRADDKQQNFLLLDCFKHNGMAFAAQASLLLQLCTVWPLILALIRSMIFELLTGEVWPSKSKAIGLVTAYMVASTVGTVLLHKIVGTVLAYIAAGAGIIYIYLLPFLVTHHDLRHGPPQSLTGKLLDNEKVDITNLLGGEEQEKKQGEAQMKKSGGAKQTMMMGLNGVVFVLGCSMLLLPFVSPIL